MKNVIVLFCAGGLSVFASLPIPRQGESKKEEGAAKPAAPVAAPETDASTQEFLKKIDEVHFNYPAAGVHSLTLRMKVGGNPMMPPEMREKMKNTALVYSWQQEPWKEALDVIGLPPEMAAQKSAYLGKGVGGMRQFVAHSSVELAKHFRVTMSKDGDATKLEWTPREGEKDFSPFVQWFDRNTKLVRGQIAVGKEGKFANFDFALVPMGTKYALAEIKQAAAEGGSVTRLEWEKRGELPVPVKMITATGPMKLEFPLELEVNPKHDPSVFEKKP